MSSRSLLDFLDAPVVVGDPDGRAVYANPAFQKAFQLSPEEVRGKPLAELFEGGGREAVLQAVAGVCSGSSAVRFRLRDDNAGFVALASPIEAEQGRVGVLILLTEELFVHDLGPALHREIQEPLDDLSRCLSELAEQSGGRRDPRYVEVIEEAARSLEKIRKRSEAWRGGSPVRGK